MRALDPRLLHRTRSARPLLATDAVLGVATALAVLRAGQPARADRRRGRSPARRFARSGSSSACSWARSCCAARSRGAWRSPGRRAAWSVLSELRLALVERRLRAQPTAADGAEGAEIAAVAVQGIEGLESYFARYLPQAILASVVPLLVIGWVAFVDLQAALIMLLTLPLVPVFMALIGRLHRAAHARALAGAAPALDATSSTSCEACRRCGRSTAPDDQAAAVARRRASATARRPWRRCA